MTARAEQSFNETLSSISTVDAPEVNSLDEILKFSRHDLETMELPALQVLVAVWKDIFLNNNLAWRDFEDVTGKFNQLQRSRLKKDPKSFYVNFLDAALQSAKSSQRLASAKVPSGSYAPPKEYHEETPIWIRMEQEANSILKIAKEQTEESYLRWQALRGPFDDRGRPSVLQSDDQRKVDEVDAERFSKTGSEREFQKQTDRYEVAFARAIRDFHMLGDSQEVEVVPPTTYDDYFRHVDFITKFQIPNEHGAAEEILLGIDFTITRNEVDQARKILRNLDQPTRSLKYNTQSLSRGQVFIPAILALDQQRSERLATYFGVQDVPSQDQGIDQTLRTEFEAELHRYRDRDIVRYEILRELLAQLRVQRERMSPAVYDDATLARYDRTLSFVQQLLEQRKNLRIPVHEEIGREGMGDVYRLADERFIRSARGVVLNDDEKLPAA